jgi:hypothetical protein
VYRCDELVQLFKIFNEKFWSKSFSGSSDTSANFLSALKTATVNRVNFL